MDKPVCAQRSPIEVELEAGEYWWCSCGRSKTQPFCDGSHAGTGFQPERFVLKKKDKVWLCACKTTRNSPYCDGSHSELED